MLNVVIPKYAKINQEMERAKFPKASALAFYRF